MKESIPLITNIDELTALKKKHASFLALLFYSDSSERSKEALALLTNIKRQKPQMPIAAVNASKTRDIHPRFGITSVPTVITMKRDRLVKKVEGLQQRGIYEALFADAPRKRADGSEAPPMRVTVYSSPTCPPCGVVKAYLRKKSVPFRVIDISRDEHGAQEIMNRTGSAAVPQTDINGTVVIGADMARIDELLGMRG
jgi:glutaredoxin